MIDPLDQLFDRAERASTDRLVGDQRKEAFDLVEPRTVGGNEMHVPAGACRQPRLDLRMLVTAVVVDDAMHVELGRDGFVDFTQKRQKFLMPVTWLASCKHRAVEHVQSGKQRGDTVTNVIVRDAFDVAEAHRQHGLRALERLALALLVHVQHQGVLRRAQVQADHVAQFLDDERVGRELESFAAMRLQAQQLEIAMRTCCRNGGLGGGIRNFVCEAG